MARNHNFNKDKVKSALNRDTNNQYNIKDKVDISDQSWQARMVKKDLSYLEYYPDSDVRVRYTKETNVVEVTAVANNGSGKCEFTSAAHGLSNGDEVVLGNFSNESYNVKGTVANKTTNTFDVTTISFVSDDTGYAAKVTDPITDDEIPALTYSFSSERIPWGKLPDYYPEEDDGTGSTTYYEDAVLVIHFKQVTSASSKYLRIRER